MNCKPGPKPHGFRGTPIYRSWSNMIQRCTNPKNEKYSIYGGRGISVCERWRDIRNFVLDMGPRPDGTSIERIDGNGNYEPSNCKWATVTEQNRNTSRNRFIEWNGERRCIADWSKKTGIHEATILQRLEAGLSIGDVLSLKSNANIVTIKGTNPATGESRVYTSVRSVRRDGFSPSVVSHCLNGRQKTHGGWVWKYWRGPEDEMLRIAGKPQKVTA